MHQTLKSWSHSHEHKNKKDVSILQIIMETEKQG